MITISIFTQAEESSIFTIVMCVIFFFLMGAIFTKNKFDDRKRDIKDDLEDDFYLDDWFFHSSNLK